LIFARIKSEKKTTLSTIIVIGMISLTVITILLNQGTEATSIETDYSSLDYDDFDQRKLEKFFDDEYDKDDHVKGRVFYSHSMMVYDTDDEQIEKELIRNTFSDFGIVSPKFYEGDNEKMEDDMDKLFEGNDGKKVEEMEFYKKIVSSCQMLVYSKWKNETASGVAIEVNHAIDIGIPVFELAGHEFLPQKVHVGGLSYEETVKMYEDH
jgi:hypothetical protein